MPDQPPSALPQGNRLVGSELGGRACADAPAERDKERGRGEAEPVMRAMVLVMAAVLAITLGEGTAMAAETDRKVLEGVPKVNHDTHFCSLAGSLESVLKYVGDPTDYDYLMGVTGLSFRRLWNRDDGGNAHPMRFAPEAVRRAFWALGYDYEILPPTQGRVALLQAVKDSLARGRPVLASGIVGPPECEIVTGYSKGGEVLHGWSEFQGFDPWRQYQDPSVPGYYAKPDWYEKAEWANGVALIVIGDKKPGPLPSRREVLLSSLKWAIELERAKTWPGIPDHSAGLAAYADWAKATEVDADYPKDNPKAMETRHMILMDQAVMVEERGNGARFLRQMADAAPEAADSLKAAADLYEQVAKEADPVYPWGPNWAKPDLADPAVRREIARHVRTAAGKETQAVALLEKAVAAMEAQSGPAAGEHTCWQDSPSRSAPRRSWPASWSTVWPPAKRRTWRGSPIPRCAARWPTRSCAPGTCTSKPRSISRRRLRNSSSPVLARSWQGLVPVAQRAGPRETRAGHPNPSEEGSGTSGRLSPPEEGR